MFRFLHAHIRDFSMKFSKGLIRCLGANNRFENWRVCDTDSKGGKSDIGVSNSSGLNREINPYSEV